MQRNDHKILLTEEKNPELPDMRAPDKKTIDTEGVKQEGSQLYISWHPGFVNAMKMELIHNEQELAYEIEKVLNQQALRIDFLAIKKNRETVIENEIGSFFRGHNLMEYKSEYDELNIDTVFKSMGYACLYKAYSKELDGIDADDITISFVRNRKPVNLFAYFRIRGKEIAERSKGIYEIQGYQFPMQIIDIRELDQDKHIWLTSLSSHLKADQIRKIITAANHLIEKNEKMYADAVLSVVTQANNDVIKNLKGDVKVCKELLEIMKPEIDAVINEAVNEAVNEAASNAFDEGVAANINNTILRMLNKNKYNHEEIADIAGTTLENVEEVARSLAY